MHSIGRQDPGGLLGKFPGEMAAVVGDGNAGILILLLQHLGQALGGLAHGKAVHPGSTGIENAPQSGCAEFQLTAKALGHQLGVGGNLRCPGSQVCSGLIRIEPASVKFHFHRPFRRGRPAVSFHSLS